MGALSTRGSHRAFPGPQTKHGRKVRPLFSPVNETSRVNKESKKMKIIKKILLLPFVVVFFPFVVGWKVARFVHERIFRKIFRIRLTSTTDGTTNEFNIAWPIRIALFLFIAWKIYAGIFYCVEFATGVNYMNEFLGIFNDTKVQSNDAARNTANGDEAAKADQSSGNTEHNVKE